jgi:rod shape-determining protein MreD
MRYLKLVLFVILLLVLQIGVFSRLIIFGVVPDLILVAVVAFTVINQDEESILFAAGASLFQDLLSYGLYLNLISKVVYSAAINAIKNSFMGSDFLLAAGVLVVFNLITFILTGIISPLLGSKGIDCWAWLISTLSATIYNLIFLPIIFSILKDLSHD